MTTNQKNAVVVPILFTHLGAKCVVKKVEVPKNLKQLEERSETIE